MTMFANGLQVLGLSKAKLGCKVPEGILHFLNQISAGNNFLTSQSAVVVDRMIISKL